MADAPAKILVVDDSASEREFAQNALVDHGYQVVMAEDGQRGLELAFREQPDLVLLDVVMPRLGGLEVCRILKAKARASGKFLPIVMLSTRNSANARIEGLKSGADDYLGKPYEAEELCVRVHGLLCHRDLARASAHALVDAPDVTAGLQARLAEEFDRAKRYDDPLACVCVGDGGPAADVQATMRQILRQIDLVFTVDDGPDHAVLLPNTHFPGALAVAERIVQARRATPNHAKVSVGVAFYPHTDVRLAQDLFDLASESLLRARDEGGGRIGLVQHQGYVYAPEG